VFTGLIRAVGRVVEQKSTAGGGVLKIKAGLAAELQLGDSMAVNGVCLTVSGLEGDWFGAEVMPATLRATNLALLRYGDLVNLEPALELGGRFGGHLVSGHVDGLGRIRRIRNNGSAILIWIDVPSDIGRIVLKGSVAVNGVSLTVQRLTSGGFEISLIPHTLKETTFFQAKVGDLVNLETDRTGPLPGQTVATATASGITEAFLEKHGFV
jgi:riboflavin synthase